MGFTYFIIQSGLPRPLATNHLEMVLNTVEATGGIELSDPCEPCNIVGIENEGLTTAFRNHLQRISVGFGESTIRPPHVVFQEMMIGHEITLTLPDVLAAFFGQMP